jgi:hypothetical protein
MWPFLLRKNSVLSAIGCHHVKRKSRRLKVAMENYVSYFFGVSTMFVICSSVAPSYLWSSAKNELE